MKRSTLKIIDIFYQIILLVISLFILYSFFQESNIHGDGRLFLIVEYFWFFLVSIVLVTIQLLSPLSMEKIHSQFKRKKKILLIQYLITFLPILFLSFNEYSFDKFFKWVVVLGLFFTIGTYLYGLLMKKIYLFDSY